MSAEVCLRRVTGHVMSCQVTPVEQEGNALAASANPTWINYASPTYLSKFPDRVATRLKY